MNARKRLVIFERLAKHIPNASTELKYTSPFELLLAVILSAQATDKSVNLATTRLFAIANTPLAILNLGQERLETYIKHIGLYRSKARHIIATCEQLLLHHQGQVPDTREALENLPGVGRKTANVILNTIFGQATIAVDTHLFRLGHRIGLAKGKTVREVEECYMTTIPRHFLRTAHHLLILHGRYTCTARDPKCTQCVISDLCEYPHKALVT
ncbi:MAG: endonuclease III [Methylophilaceae bacterium]|nr:endonuclease III [Methylophilaceae bacterium]